MCSVMGFEEKSRILSGVNKRVELTVKTLVIFALEAKMGLHL